MTDTPETKPCDGTDSEPNPLWGCMAGTVALAPGTDLTDAALPGWTPSSNDTPSQD